MQTFKRFLYATREPLCEKSPFGKPFPGFVAGCCTRLNVTIGNIISSKESICMNFDPEMSLVQ